MHVCSWCCRRNDDDDYGYDGEMRNAVITANDTAPPPNITLSVEPSRSVRTWPTPSGIDEAQARGICQAPIVQSYYVYSACVRLTYTSFEVITESCVQDVLVTSVFCFSYLFVVIFKILSCYWAHVNIFIFVHLTDWPTDLLINWLFGPLSTCHLYCYLCSVVWLMLRCLPTCFPSCLQSYLFAYLLTYLLTYLESWSFSLHWL